LYPLALIIAAALLSHRRSTTHRFDRPFEVRSHATGSDFIRADGRKQVYHSRDHASTACLMTGAQASPIVAVEILEELQVIAPMRVSLKFLAAAEDGAATSFVTDENTREPARYLFSYLMQSHQVPAVGRTFDIELVAIVGIILQQGVDDERVDRHPDRPAPVSVATKHYVVGFRRQIRDAVFRVTYFEHVRMLGMITGESTQTEGTEELVFVEHFRPHSAYLGFVENKDVEVPVFVIV
jgi:hypothetical protein